MDNGLSIGLNAYENIGSLGAGLSDDALSLANISPEALMEINKALEAGQLQGGVLTGGQSSGGALKRESLEASLKLITFKESDIRFWKRIYKDAAFNTVEEYIQQTSYGNDRGGFFGEGGLPEGEDSVFARKAEHVKYIGNLREVTDQMQLVRTNIGSMIQKATQDGILWILRKANRALFFGDSAIIPLEWNGIYAQHLNNDQYSTLEEYLASELVIDLRGKTLKEADIEKGSLTLMTKFAQADLMIAPPIVFTDFSIGFYNSKRLLMGNAGAVNNVTAGNRMNNFQTQAGPVIDFEYDIFAAHFPGKFATAGTVPPKAPAAPTSVSAVIASADTSSKFADGKADYWYGASALNEFGESAVVQIGAGKVTVDSDDDAVDLTFTATAGAYAPKAYVIYRSLPNPTTAFAVTTLYPIMTVPATGSDAKRGSLASGVDGGAAGKVRDRNRFLPATEEAILMQSDSDTLMFKQLAPLHKSPLARLATADRFMILLYGTPILFRPSFMIRYINIGRVADITA